MQVFLYVPTPYFSFLVGTQRDILSVEASPSCPWACSRGSRWDLLVQMQTFFFFFSQFSLSFGELLRAAIFHQWQDAPQGGGRDHNFFTLQASCETSTAVRTERLCVSRLSQMWPLPVINKAKSVTEGSSCSYMFCASITFRAISRKLLVLEKKHPFLNLFLFVLYIDAPTSYI